MRTHSLVRPLAPLALLAGALVACGAAPSGETVDSTSAAVVTPSFTFSNLDGSNLNWLVRPDLVSATIKNGTLDVVPSSGLAGTFLMQRFTGALWPTSFATNVWSATVSGTNVTLDTADMTAAMSGTDIQVSIPVSGTFTFSSQWGSATVVIGPVSNVQFGLRYDSTADALRVDSVVTGGLSPTLKNCTPDVPADAGAVLTWCGLIQQDGVTMGNSGYGHEMSLAMFSYFQEAFGNYFGASNASQTLQNVLAFHAQSVQPVQAGEPPWTYEPHTAQIASSLLSYQATSALVPQGCWASQNCDLTVDAFCANNQVGTYELEELQGTIWVPVGTTSVATTAATVMIPTGHLTGNGATPFRVCALTGTGVPVCGSQFSTVLQATACPVAPTCTTGYQYCATTKRCQKGSCVQQ